MWGALVMLVPCSTEDSGSEVEDNGSEEGDDLVDEEEREWKSLQETMKKKQQKAGEKGSKDSHPVHAPFFPDVRHTSSHTCHVSTPPLSFLLSLSPPCPSSPLRQVKQECWWLYIADYRHQQMVVPPQRVSGLKTELTQDLQFAAPDRPCRLQYSVVLTSDSYLNLQFAADLKVRGEG